MAPVQLEPDLAGHAGLVRGEERVEGVLKRREPKPEIRKLRVFLGQKSLVVDKFPVHHEPFEFFVRLDQHIRGRGFINLAALDPHKAILDHVKTTNAELPGMYTGGDYDLAGFAVGAVERDGVLTGSDVVVGDVVLGLASTGVHSNGYSLVRRVVERAGLDYHAPAPFAPDRSLADALLTPTRIYVRSLLPPIRTGLIKALAHVTGGGLIENIPRVLPQGLGVTLDAAAWTLPPVFRWLARTGGVTPAELARTFNCGIGMVVIASQTHATDLAAQLSAAGETVTVIGRIRLATSDGPRVAITAMESTWRD